MTVKIEDLDQKETFLTPEDERLIYGGGGVTSTNTSGSGSGSDDCLEDDTVGPELQ
ncbi:MAG TPA: hypothetical protein VJ302_28895 [Blastocatellia bacterium]|nr:hypothetical protein [Blastocatellia bacterium]